MPLDDLSPPRPRLDLRDVQVDVHLARHVNKIGRAVRLRLHRGATFVDDLLVDFLLQFQRLVVPISLDGVVPLPTQLEDDHAETHDGGDERERPPHNGWPASAARRRPRPTTETSATTS